MPTLQTDYLDILPVGAAGVVVSTYPRKAVSRRVATGAILFGAAAAQGASDKAVIPYAGTGYVGIAIHNRAEDIGVSGASGGALDRYDVGAMAAILIKGVIWVIASVAVTAGQQAYLTTGGAWTNVVGTNLLVPGARFDTAAGIGGLTQLRID